jgi:hypothetical protein
MNPSHASLVVYVQKMERYVPPLILLQVLAGVILGVVLGLTAYTVSIERQARVCTASVNVTVNASAGAGAGAGGLVLDTTGECGDGNTCTVDLVHPTAHYCERPPASTAVACTDTAACYDAGAAGTLHCDGRGACVSDNVSACKGYCPWGAGVSEGLLQFPDLCAPLPTSFCTAQHFPLKPYFYTPAVTGFPFDDAQQGAFFDIYTLLFPYGMCYAQVCQLSVLQLQAQSTAGTTFWPLFGASTTCADMLDTRSVTVNVSACIVATELPVDSDFLNAYIRAAIAGGYTGQDVERNYTGRLCTFRYACARYNESALYDPANLGPQPIQLLSAMQALNASSTLLAAWNASVYHRGAGAGAGASSQEATAALAATMARFDAHQQQRRRRRRSVADEK